MRWLSRRTARVEERSLSHESSAQPTVFVPAPLGEVVTAERGMRIADVYACVRALADAAASLPLIAYRRRPEGRERLQSGRLVDLLDRPAPATTQANLIGQMVAHLNTHGNAYVGKYRRDGAVAELGLLAPDRVVPELRAGRPIYTYTSSRGRRQTLTTDDVVHVRAMSSDGLVGLSPIRQCQVALGLSSALSTYGRAYFENDARPSGIISLPEGIVVDSELRTEIRSDFEAKHRGPENAGRVAIFAGAVDFTPISPPADDLQFIEQRKLSATEIARIFRVPPWIVGAEDGGSQTYSNVEQQSLHFATYSLRPWLTLIEQALSADPDLCTQNTYVEFLIDALLRSDSATRSEFYTRALDPMTGWMSREEVRRLENLEPENAPQPVPATTNGAGNPNHVGVAK